MKPTCLLDITSPEDGNLSKVNELFWNQMSDRAGMSKDRRQVRQHMTDFYQELTDIIDDIEAETKVKENPTMFGRAVMQPTLEKQYKLLGEAMVDIVAPKPVGRPRCSRTR